MGEHQRQARIKLLSLAAFALPLCILLTLKLFPWGPKPSLKVSIKNIPEGTSFLAVVAKTNRGVAYVPWDRPGSAYGTYYPPEDTMSYCNGFQNLEEVYKAVFVESVAVTEYGIILRKTNNKKWTITWFDPSVVKAEKGDYSDRYATFDLKMGRTLPVNAKQFERLELGQIEKAHAVMLDN